MISVVITTFNGEKFIIEQLDSIANQTLKPDQVIISDDGSNDETLNIVQKYIERNALKGWTLTRNSREKGFFNNFFSALHYATGDYIFLADQDDVWDLNKIKNFVNLYNREQNVTMIQSNVVFVDKNDEIINGNVKYHGKSNIDEFIELTIEDICKFAGSGYTMSFTKDVLDVIFKNAFDRDTQIYEFHDILIGLVSVGMGRCLLSGEIYDKHRLHDRNVTQTCGRNYIEGRTKARQLDILIKRENVFSNLKCVCNSEKKRKIFENCSYLAHKRGKYIEHFSIGDLLELIKYRKLYASKFGLISDSLYSLGCEKFLLKLYRLV